MKMELGQMPQLTVRLCRNCVDYKHQRDLYLRKFQNYELKLGKFTTNKNANLLRDAEKEIRELKEILSQKIKLREENKARLENEKANATLDVREDATVAPTHQNGGPVPRREAAPGDSERASYQICRWTIQKQRGASKLCRQVFTTPELVTHISEKHTGNTCFWHECQHYGVPFKDTRELLIHIRFHVYRCTVFDCTESFFCSQELEEHKSSHRRRPKEVPVRDVGFYCCTASGHKESSCSRDPVERKSCHGRKEAPVRDVGVYPCTASGCNDSSCGQGHEECKSSHGRRWKEAPVRDVGVFRCTASGCNDSSCGQGHEERKASHGRRWKEAPVRDVGVYPCMASGCTDSSCDQGHEERKASHGRRYKELSVRDVEVYRCLFDGCRMTFDNSCALVRHNNSVHGSDERRFQCAVKWCNIMFETKSNLHDHMREHQREHAKTYSDVRPFRCEVPCCGLSFTDSGVLAEHRKKHVEK